MEGGGFQQDLRRYPGCCSDQLGLAQVSSEHLRLQLSLVHSRYCPIASVLRRMDFSFAISSSLQILPVSL